MKEDAAFAKTADIVNVVNLDIFLNRKTENLKSKCKYYPCHNLDDSIYDCRTCYCPFYDICTDIVNKGNDTVFGGYLLNGKVLACEKCTYMHHKNIVDYIYSRLDENATLEDIYNELILKYESEERNGKS